MGPPFSLDFPRAYGTPPFVAKFREYPEDFQVEEQLGFAPCGEGEHCFFQVRKRGHNTQWVAQQLAAFAQVAARDIGYCGLKDRHAITTQWFSIYDPKKRVVAWDRFHLEGVEILTRQRHSHKLKPGSHQANRFDIILRDVREVGTGSDEVSQCLRQVAQGVPNYFGEQRFGRDGHNLQLAHDWFDSDRRLRQNKLRGLVMSAARAYLFNVVLAARVRAGTWTQTLDGDVDNEQHLPTGPLWGRGRPPVSGATLMLEQSQLQPWSCWCGRLEHLGLQQERRPLLLVPQGFVARREQDQLHLSFRLRPGEFATSVLRELATLVNVMAAERLEPAATQN